MESRHPERRRNRVYLTRNTEYHVRSEVCVAVRDRNAMTWSEDHPAIGRKMGACLRMQGSVMLPCAEHPGVGDAIVFRRGESDMVTSKIVDIGRPTREELNRYWIC